MRVAVVPAKGFGSAKQRLAGALRPEARAGLARAMLEDVLATLAGVGLDRILVVTPDPEVAELARRHGATVVPDLDRTGHTAAVAQGLAACRELGATALLTVPGDIPCLTAREVGAVISACPQPPAAVFVPSRNGLGTNAAYLAPPDAVPLRFGEPSFADHIAAARARGIEPVVLDCPGISLDVDGPDDLELLRTRGAGTRAGRLVADPHPTPGPPAGVVPAGVVEVARLELLGLRGLPEIRPGDDLAALTVTAASAQGTPLAPGDVLVVSQKVVSKAEGRLVRLVDVAPSPFAQKTGRTLKKDPRLVEVILRESRRIVRMDRGILITETHHGQICANAGVDQSNVGGGWVSLLPEDPDASARAIAARIRDLTGLEVAVIVSDTFGRPWREGLHNVAIGVAGMRPLASYLGAEDRHGYTLQATVLAVADELAGAAELVMGKLDQVPVALVRGFAYTPGAGSARELLRDPAHDLFR